MTYFENLFWVSFPYIMLTMFVVGHFYRYHTDQFGWSAKSSEFLEKDQLKWASILFHYGIIFAFFGHVAGILVPFAFYQTLKIPDHLYHMGALWIGGLAGILALIGVVLFVGRRFGVKRISINSTFRDGFTVVLLTFVVLTGLFNTIYYSVGSAEFDYRTSIGPWFRGLLYLDPKPGLMIGIPLGYRIHIVLAFLLFGIWPFTRLVHVWSLPLEYLGRKYVVYRALFSRKLLMMQTNRDRK
jgi:nitrate reductase gamma subunit